MALKPAADSFPELLLSKDTRNIVPCRGAWRQSCEAFGVSLGGAASSADLGCSSEYSTADHTADISLKAEVGKGFVSTAIGHESLGTKANVGPHLWNGVIASLWFAWGMCTPSWLKVKRV